MATSNESFFQRLNRLFRSGPATPAIRRKMKGLDKNNYYDTRNVIGKNGYYSPNAFRRENGSFSIMGVNDSTMRMSRYIQFAEMESRAEIAAALDIYADETCSVDERGQMFHIYSDNPRILAALEELFYDVCNIEYDGRRWVRNVVKTGDFFLYFEVVEGEGIVRVRPLPVQDVVREEGFDREDLEAYRFKLESRGNLYLQPWQVAHMRNLSNEQFTPYGTSFLDPALRPWRVLTMMEDAMLVYRIVKSPERRVFYIDVSAVPSSEVPTFMEAVRQEFEGDGIVDKLTGREDFRYEPVSIMKDYFVPIRQNSQTKIDTLAGGQHLTAVDDVEYVLKQLIAALKIPRAYLTYDESLSSKATLAAEDIRFSRTINGIQKVILPELNKMAMIHLLAKGFDDEDLIDFELKFSNPSTIALQQKLALWSSKFDTASKALESKLVDTETIQRDILEYSSDKIQQIRKGQLKDKLWEKKLEALSYSGEETNSNIDPFDKSNYEVPNSPVVGVTANNNQTASSQLTAGTDAAVSATGSKVTMSVPGVAADGSKQQHRLSFDVPPVKANATPDLNKARNNADRRVEFTGKRALSMPDFEAMLSPDNKYAKDPFDTNFFKSLSLIGSPEKEKFTLMEFVENELISKQGKEERKRPQTRMLAEHKRMLNRMRGVLLEEKAKKKTLALLREAANTAVVEITDDEENLSNLPDLVKKPLTKEFDYDAIEFEVDENE